MSATMRRPEANLTVIWQRHIPEGTGNPKSDERVDAIANLAMSVEEALESKSHVLDHGDLVVTISKRT